MGIIKRKIVMLSTEKETLLFTHQNGRIDSGPEECLPSKDSKCTNKHLYVLGGKELDGYYYDNYTKKVYHTGGADYEPTEQCYSIIATTDSDLSLPMIHPGFLKGFVYRRGTNEVNVWYQSVLRGRVFHDELIIIDGYVNFDTVYEENLYSLTQIRQAYKRGNFEEWLKCGE